MPGSPALIDLVQPNQFHVALVRFVPAHVTVLSESSDREKSATADNVCLAAEHAQDALAAMQRRAIR